MTSETAIAGIEFLLLADKDQVLIANGLKRPSKKANKEYARALRAIFMGLTGREPTTDELNYLYSI